MSDEWNFFPCQMGDHQASIFYDHGIRETIDAVAPPHLLQVRAAFRRSLPNGMYDPEEFSSLQSLEDELQKLVKARQALYVGRITVDGHRHFYIYTAESEETWASETAALAARHNYSLAIAWHPNNERRGYWQELFPTADDWQVIKDLKVLDTLQREGDDPTAMRRTDHWAYFASQGAAELFADWVQENGYHLESCTATEKDRYCVKFHHDVTMQLADITAHTIALRRRTDELDGDYDGWETFVCKPSI